MRGFFVALLLMGVLALALAPAHALARTWRVELNGTGVNADQKPRH